MDKLLILDKDGTLVAPKSGSEFVQHPEDQELLPGVKEAIERYHSEGWAIVVASNQGGCAWQKVHPKDVKVGQHIRCINSKLYLGKVSKNGRGLAGDRSLISVSEGGLYLFMDDEQAEVRWKSEEEAIAEMRYLMELLPEIQYCFFCPDFEGEDCYWLDGPNDCIPLNSDGCSLWRGTFRKPYPGMINAAIALCSPIWKPWDFDEYGNLLDGKVLMVGDRAEDEGAAKAAGVRFISAEDWRAGE